MPPRRSSRARTTQPSTTGPQLTNSSASSNSSSRAERSTRSHHKGRSPPAATPPQSRSSEDVGELPRNHHSEPPQTRRRKRELEHDDNAAQNPMDEEIEGEGEEEEITRCICGNQDYPGLPVALQNSAAQVDSKAGIKDGTESGSIVHAIDPLPEDAGGLFIQCDICKVWQHGGCVGILEVAMSPDEYFCEQCRKDLHKVVAGADGQKSSRYLPVLEAISPKPSRGSSQAHDTDAKVPNERRTSRPSINASALSTKRRSTMNSRDAAYDEGEQLRRAIEESKGGAKTSGSLDDGHNGLKRGRSESEEAHDSNKRQRTSSTSHSSTSRSNMQAPTQSLNFDDEGQADKESNTGGARKIRGAAARNQREKELRDREFQKEKVRADAAGRRKGRAERRRGDESDHSDESPPSRTISTKDIPKQAPHTREPPSSSQPPPDTPPPANPTPPNPSHRKIGRPLARKGRVGRNQYTKDRDPPPDTNGDHSLSPQRSISHDRAQEGEKANGINGTSSVMENSNKQSKQSRQSGNSASKNSMNEMKRRVTAILEFISKTQVDMAGSENHLLPPPPPPPHAHLQLVIGGADGAAPSSTSSTTSSSSSLIVKGLVDGLHEPSLAASNNDDRGEKGEKMGTDKEEKRHFAQLSSLEMMDFLTRRLVLWQKEFGKHGEK